MAGLLFDIVLLAIIAAFAWGGYRLGLIISATRLVGGLIALVVAVLLARPASGIFTATVDMEPGLATFIALIILGLIAYILASKVVRDAFGYLPEDRFYHRDGLLGATFGGLTGLLWAWIMLITLVLLPSESIIARGAIDSNAGRLLIAYNEPALRWTSDSFERYTQALPKDPDGAIVGRYPREAPFHEPESASANPDAADDLLAGINEQRREHEARDVLVESELSNIAEQHALQAVRSRTIATEPPTDTSLATRVDRVVGGDTDIERFRGTIVWARGEAAALRGMLRPGGVADIVLDENWDEVGLGVADAGWFFGRVYVLVFVDRAAAPTSAGDREQSTPEEPAPDADAPSSGSRGTRPADGPGGGDGAPDDATDSPADGGSSDDVDDPFAPGPVDDDVSPGI